jgi:hypothetical protein
MQELANGGKSVSAKDTTSTESESSTEETAVAEDLVELKSWLIISSVDLFQEEQETDNGTMSNAQDHFLVKRSDL